MARACSSQSNIFQKLHTYYRDREAVPRIWREEGETIVGTLGCDIPDEILMAAGMRPLRVCADPAAPLGEVDTYLEFSFDPVVRAQFDRIINGTYHRLVDYLAISNSTDVLIRIYFYLREMHRIEPERPIPAIAFVDWLFTRFLMHQERNERTIAGFIRTVEQWAGRSISQDALQKASAVCNENRAALREFASLRYGEGCRITGSEALTVIGAGLFMEKAAHTALVRALTAQAKSWDKVESPRVFYTGSVQEDTGLYDLIGAAGMNVVSEDHDWGDRHMDRDVDLSLDPISGIVDRYMLRAPSSKKSFTKERVQALCDAVSKSGAQGVIFYMNLYEEAASWDYPAQKKALEQMGIPSLILAKQPYPLRDTGGLTEALRQFGAQLKGVPSNG